MIRDTRIHKLIYKARDFRSRELFRVLKVYLHGSVLDVGGGNFFHSVKTKDVNYHTWTVLETEEFQHNEPQDDQIRFVQGDGCKLPFAEKSFNAVLNIQVLEHVFEPMEMVYEMAKVLKINGKMILLIPQTSVIHMVPYHYYNFTRFWIEEALRRAQMKILILKPLGGFWSSMASHLVFFFLQSFRYPGLSSLEIKRSPFFYILFPFMAIFALIALPICIIMSLGDLSEEPNNHLVVAEKLPT